VTAERRTVALIPVNRLDRAKGRLAEILTPDERAALALATFETVVRAALEAGLAAVVLTADERVREATPTGAACVGEAAGVAGLNAQIEHALAGLGDADGVLILHADLPLATAEALVALCEAAPAAPSAALVRSEDGGTNAMLLRPPGRFSLAYGPGSFAVHEARARAAGMTVRVVAAPALALDLDTPGDIKAFLAEPGSAETPAGRALRAMGFPKP
jgi:2-phospho-L-lactate guanylyltransferase